jgi:hypothetical protein
MEQTFDVVTPTAFIMGQISISGMVGRGNSLEARVIAQAEGQIVDTVAKSGSTYMLLVTPGPWTVSAEVGAVVSKPTTVSLQPGETAEVNFWFGRRS